MLLSLHCFALQGAQLEVTEARLYVVNSTFSEASSSSTRRGAMYAALPARAAARKKSNSCRWALSLWYFRLQYYETVLQSPLVYGTHQKVKAEQRQTSLAEAVARDLRLPPRQTCLFGPAS